MNKCKWEKCTVVFNPTTSVHEFCSKKCRLKYNKKLDNARCKKPVITKKTVKQVIDYGEWLDYST